MEVDITYNFRFIARTQVNKYSEPTDTTGIIKICSYTSGGSPSFFIYTNISTTWESPGAGSAFTATPTPSYGSKLLTDTLIGGFGLAKGSGNPKGVSSIIAIVGMFTLIYQ